VKQCVEAAEAFELERRERKGGGQPLIPDDLKYCCSDLRRTWQSLSAFNLQRESRKQGYVSEGITMLPYMHEFEYKSILPYAVDDVFLTKGYLAAAGKFLGRLATLTETGSLAVAGVSAGVAALGLTAAAPAIGPALMVAGAAAAPAMVDQFSTRAEDQPHEEGWWRDVKGLGKRFKPSTFKNKTEVRRRRLLPRWQNKKKNQGGGSIIARGAIGRPGKDQFLRGQATENRSKLRGEGVFVGTEFTAEIPQLNTVTVNMDFYRWMKSSDPVLQEYRYTFFGILIECNNHIPTKGLKSEDLKPSDPKFLASFRRSYNSMGSQQEKVNRGLAELNSGGCRIKLMKGDITTFGPGVISGTESKLTNKFAIVNAASVRVVGSGARGVDKSIFEKAGGHDSELEKQRIVYNQVQGENLIPGSVFTTESTNDNYGDIRVKHIIHAIPPDFRCITIPDQGNKCHGSSSKEDCIRLLQKAYQDSIAEAVRLGVEYLAFPILSGSIFKGEIPFEEVVKVAIETINKTDKGGIKVIFIYGYFPEDYQILKEVLAGIVVGGQGGGYRKTHRKKKRKKNKKTRRKKKSKKTKKKTKMRKKKTHKRTKKNKKNKINP